VVVFVKMTVARKLPPPGGITIGGSTGSAETITGAAAGTSIA
jgi:hypothetical protein